MENKKNKSEVFDSSNLLIFLIKNKKPVFLAIALSAIISSIASFLIVPKFKSTVILFPTTTNSIAKALLSDRTGENQDVLEFGEEEEAEKMIQVLKSDEIKNKVISKFDLFAHYEIDSTGSYPLTELHEEFDDNITFKRTEFMSVRIDVLDKDPQIAADIANLIAALLDSTTNRMQHERAEMAFKIVEKNFIDLNAEIRSKEDSLNRLRALGINDYESQSEVLNDAYAQAIVAGKTGSLKPLEEKLKTLSQYGGAYVSLRDDLEHLRKQMSNIKARYEDARVDANQVLPHKFIVNNAYKAEKKSYPLRWLIVMVSCVSSVLICIVLLLIKEKIQEFQAINNNG